MISIEQFWAMVQTNPFLAIVMFLVLGTIFVNGATDAANAIAEPVGTRAINVDAAIFMSVVCNFIGLIGMTLVSTAGGACLRPPHRAHENQRVRGCQC